jgi:hypothetical protein
MLRLLFALALILAANTLPQPSLAHVHPHERTAAEAASTETPWAAPTSAVQMVRPCGPGDQPSVGCDHAKQGCGCAACLLMAPPGAEEMESPNGATGWRGFGTARRCFGQGPPLPPPRG